MITSNVGAIIDMCERSLTDESSPSIIERLSALGKEIPLAANRWKISLLLKSLVEPVNAALKERQHLFEKYGTLENNRWMMGSQRLPEYNQELRDLRREKVELNVSPLPLEIFDNSDLTASDLVVLVDGGIVIPPA